jgi:hypothetical protein
VANTHPAERQRTLGVGASSQVPAPPRQLIPPLGVHGRSPRATGHLTSRSLEKQCRRAQDSMREKPLRSIAATGAHPQAAPSCLDLDLNRGALRCVATGRRTRAKMPALCARQLIPELYAQ